MAVEYDEIGIWSEVKLAITKEYASAYATILDAKRRGCTLMRLPVLASTYRSGRAQS